MCNDKQTIQIVRGTTAGFSVAITDAETGEAYTLEPGEVLRFGVKKLPEDPACIFEIEFDEADDDGDYGFTIGVNNTKNMAFGSYFYDIGLQSGNNYFNVIPASPFEITYNVTKWEAVTT